MADDGMTMGYLMGQSEGGSGGGGGGWGGFGEGLWAVIILAILFGRGGFGFGGNGGGGGDGNCATQADVRSAVDQQTLISKLDQQTYGLADATYALNNTINNGFYGVDRSICNIGYQIADCCCKTERAIDGVNYNLATQFCNLGNTIQNTTRDIIDNQNANYRGIMDFMVQSKLDALRTENDNLRLAASQAKQNQYLIDQLKPCPVPAYITCNPYTASWGVGLNNGCGCGCG